MIRLLILADIRLYREGLAQALAGQPDLAVVGTAADPAEALALLQACQPDLVLVDTATAASLVAVRAIRAQQANITVVALGVAEEERDVVACVEAGVAGYVPREASLDDLVVTLHRIARGEAACSRRMTGALARRLAARAAQQPDPGPDPVLTTREREILRLVADGLANKEIAQRLGIEVATVKNHVHNLFGKLHVRRRGEAAARWRRQSVASTL